MEGGGGVAFQYLFLQRIIETGVPALHVGYLASVHQRELQLNVHQGKPCLTCRSSSLLLYFHITFPPESALVFYGVVPL